MALIGAIAMFGGGIANLVRGFTISSSGVDTNGTVVRLEHHAATRRRPAHDEAFVEVAVAGTTGTCSVSGDGLSVGDTVPVRAVVDAGTVDCVEPGFFSLWGLALGLLCCGGPFFLLVGVVLFFGGEEKRREDDFR
jgi:hypothetical protein